MIVVMSSILGLWTGVRLPSSPLLALQVEVKIMQVLLWIILFPLTFRSVYTILRAVADSMGVSDNP